MAVLPTSPELISLPKADKDIPQAAPNPVLSDLPPTSSDMPAANSGGSNKFSEAAIEEKEKIEALSDLPPPIAPEASDKVGDAPANTAPLPPAVSLPTVDVPVALAPALPAPPGLAVPLPGAPPGLEPTGAPEKEPAKKTAAKTWQTRLKPVSTAYDTRYQYRRVLMPGVIYRTQYNLDNQHLPTRVTRSDYEYLLFQRAAMNDVDGTRALLNAGTYINTTNTRGETPLAVARRHGAQQTAMLLQARGAR